MCLRIFFFEQKSWPESKYLGPYAPEKFRNAVEFSTIYVHCTESFLTKTVRPTYIHFSSSSSYFSSILYIIHCIRLFALNLLRKHKNSSLFITSESCDFHTSLSLSHAVHTIWSRLDFFFLKKKIIIINGIDFGKKCVLGGKQYFPMYIFLQFRWFSDHQTKLKISSLWRFLIVKLINTHSSSSSITAYRITHNCADCTVGFRSSQRAHTRTSSKFTLIDFISGRGYF